MEHFKSLKELEDRTFGQMRVDYSSQSMGRTSLLFLSVTWKNIYTGFQSSRNVVAVCTG